MKQVTPVAVACPTCGRMSSFDESGSLTCYQALTRGGLMGPTGVLAEKKETKCDHNTFVVRGHHIS